MSRGLTPGLAGILPHRAVRPLGRRLGDLAWVVGRGRRRALEHLAAALPELGPEARERTVRESFRNAAAARWEARSALRFDRVAFCRHLTLEGWEQVEAAAEAGRGILFLLPPLGIPEIAACPPGLYGGPLHLLDATGVPLPPASARDRFGLETLAGRDVMDRALERLAAGGRVGMGLRVGAGGTALELELLGRPVRVSDLPARLALASGAPLVSAVAVPAPRGSYLWAALPPIAPPSGATGDGEATVLATTAGYLRSVEQQVRRWPELWPWGL